MWERYQFLRYYLPGFLFFIYLGVLLIPQLLPLSTIELSVNQVVAIFASIIIASPVVGYLIYCPFSLVYEYHYSKKNRKALDFVEGAEFAEDDEDKRWYKKQIVSFAQKKELLDLVFHSVFKTSEADRKKTSDVEVSPSIVEELQNYLDNFAGRIVCGVFSPIAAVATFGGVLLAYSVVAGESVGIISQFNWTLLGISFAPIVIASVLLFIDAERVIREYFELENYFVRSKKKELNLLLQKIFPRV